MALIWRFDCVIKSNKTGCILTAWYCSCFVSLRTFDFRNEKAKKRKKTRLHWTMIFRPHKDASLESACIWKTGTGFLLLMAQKAEGSWTSQGNHSAKYTCSLVEARKRMANGLDWL